jgi:hypothetical protein
MTDSHPPQQNEELDPAFQAAMQRLHELTVWGRWAVVLGLWLTIGLVSLWGLRENIQLIQDHFTWAAIRAALIYQRWSSLGLVLCIAMTVSVLVWQSRNILFGLSPIEQERLQKQLWQIQQQGNSHPLWKWVYRAK